MTDPRIEAAARCLFGDKVDQSSGAREYLLGEVGKALAAADAAAWREIATAPRDGTLILVPVKHIGCDVVGWWCEGWRETTNGLMLRDEPTHWQPLPAPPTSSDALGGVDG